MSILTFAKTKTISGAAGFAFEQPVTVLRLIFALAFFLVQWNVYAVVLTWFGATSLVNFVLSLGCAALVTYKLFRYLKIAKKGESDEN